MARHMEALHVGMKLPAVSQRALKHRQNVVKLFMPTANDVRRGSWEY